MLLIMSEQEHLRREVDRLQRLCRRQQADYDILLVRVKRLEVENTALCHERDEWVAQRQALSAALLQERRQHADTRQHLADLVQAFQTLDERAKALMRRQFGASSERLCGMGAYIPELLAYFQEHGLVDADQADGEKTNTDHNLNAETEPAASTIAAAHPAATTEESLLAQADTGKNRKRPDGVGGRKPLPKDLERRAWTFVPPEDHPAFQGAVSYDCICTTTIERYQISPVTVYVEAISCPIMAITHHSGVTYQETVAPPTVTGRSQVSDGFIVRSVIDKVADHLPANRQSKRLERMDCLIERSKLCRWHIETATFLKPLWEAIFGEILTEPVVGIDDTVHRLIVADRSVCKQGRLWAVSGSAGICYQFNETREGKWITELLEDFQGGVMGDAYAGHHKLLQRDDILALFCWAHVRRKFVESSDIRRRNIMVQLIARLYHIEDELADATPDQRVCERRRQSQPILAQIYETLCAWQADPQVLPKSGIGRATSYALKLWDGLKRYCDIGEAPIDNNHTERGMRPNALHRKNSLFSASIKGAESYAILLTVVQSALIHNLNPETYLNDVIEAMHYQRLPVAELTPAAYAKRQMAECKIPS